MDGYIGQIILFAGTFAPRNWAICNGEVLAISGNEALFSIIGVTYGGDGRTTFALPNMAPVADTDGQGQAAGEDKARGGGGDDHFSGVHAGTPISQVSRVARGCRLPNDS